MSDKSAWFRQCCLADLGLGSGQRSRRADPHRLRPMPVPLENRQLLSTFTVESTSDDGNTGTLRWAVEQADAATSPSTIDFNLGTSAQTITLSQGPLVLSNTAESIAIDGPGADKLEINGNKASGVFQVSEAVTASLKGLTITGGDGGFLDSGGGLDGPSGGLDSLGSVAITDCTISGNFGGKGGGLTNGGTMTVSDCTISGNSSGVSGFAGGLLNQGVATVGDCTISNNSGGGIENDSGGTATLDACTVTGNSGGLAGGLYNDGTATLTDTIVAGNIGLLGGVASDIGGSNASEVKGTYNLIGTGGSGGIQGGTQDNIVLSSLAA